ncbi:phragmoplast orienting kinesin 2 [Panicum miliaceum]|uniref:Phragmoplast orienting kinesin 2 n=1 Tax=Panicum miliaceum TaxID=4540 RepID=A0A3L6R905_PANMI|nr:phragmoplast orienting kinesin 2 [Panicum miliaceum]
MVRDLAAPRRTPARAASASEAGNDENAPGDASDVAAVAADPGAASRPPLLAIQPPASGLKRKPDSPAPTPSKLPFRTPEKAVARSRFGWVPPRGEEPPPRAGAGAPPYTAMTTPRAHRGKAPVPAASEGGSTQSTPTKSVTKPAYSIGMSGSRPPMSGGRPRVAGFGMGFSTSGRGAPLSLGPAAVVNSAEVPHFELREDPSFWMDNNVQVVIRVRPLNNNEKNLHSYNRCLKQESAQSITWIGHPETRFTFDHVACETVDQEVLFRVAGLPMVENCMAGYNSCVFAYGQTGSGKTYTMLGEISDLEVRPSPDRGMTPRIFEFLFARIRAEEESRRDEKLKYSCKCSFLEIYNEQITDLLDPSSSNLQLREDIRKEVYVENLTELEVGCVSDIIKLLMQGSANRKVAATNMNRESSRSHSVFTCIIESRWEKDSASNLRFARLNLVDLAGSERQRTSGAEGERLKEAANINKSLSTLGLVIMNLVDLAHGKERHVPYRDSRLTFLLQDSLGGNSKTMIIANVSPSVCSANETLSTLKFAQRARLIQNNAVVNEDASGDVLALQHQIRLLKEELAVLKRQHVTRSLSFTADIFGGDVNDGNVYDKNDNDANNSSSLKDLQNPNKQLKSLEEALAGALRRESAAENTIRELELEIEQLNELVRQREHDTRSAKMMLKFRDEKIHRMDALVNKKLPAESYLLEENKTLSQEIDLLKARLDKNPEVTRFALENIRLSSQLKRSQEFFDEGERELLLNEIAELRNQVSQILEARIETEQQNIFPAKSKDSQQHSIGLESDAEIVNMDMELKRTSQELEACRGDLQACLESNRKLTREMADLEIELNALKILKEEEPRVFENSSPLHQFDSDTSAKMEDCFDETFKMEELLNLQLELDIIKTILVEERTSRAEVEEKSACLVDELQSSNIRILQACKRNEALERELNDSRSVIEALESQQIMLINELDELKNNNQQSIELLEKRDMEISRLKNELDILRRQEYLTKEEPKTQLLKCYDNEDSPLQTKLKRMQASLEKVRNLNTMYQRDQASHCSAEQEMDEVRRQVEVETAEVIVRLQEELISVQQQLDASNKKDLLAKQSIDELQLEIMQLNDKLLEVLKKNESLSSVIEDKEKEIELLTNDWNRLVADIGIYLVDGNAALSEASDQDKDQAIEKLKNEEFTILLRLMSEIVKANGIIRELGVGLNTLQSSISISPEETTCQDSDLKLEDRVDLREPEAFQPVEQQNVEVLCQLSKEMEFTVLGMKMMQSQMTKYLQEKENLKESQRTINDLRSEVFKFNAEIVEKERYYEARLKELEVKIQGNDASLISWNKEKEALEHEVSEAKLLMAQKSFESATLIAKFEEAQATISDADSTVKALVEANEKAKRQAERYQEKEALFIAEKDVMLSEISSLKMLLDTKEQSYKLMERKFQSGLLEANEVALELEDGIRLLQNLLIEKLEFVSSDVEWMKEKLQQFAELVRTWLEENWLEIIGKDCAISVLHLCHMGILLERITGLNAENGFLQRGLCESNSLISKLREHNDKAKNELEMCSVLKGKLLLDINNSFSRITKKEQEATKLNTRLDSFEKKILHLQAQEEAMVARSNSMYNELSNLIEEIDATNRSALAAESKEKEELRHQLDEALLLNGMLKDKMLIELNLIQMNSSIPFVDIKGCSEFELCHCLADYRSDLVVINMIAKDIESTVLASELKQHKLHLQEQRVMFTNVLEGLMEESTLWKVDQDLENVAICILHEENNAIRADLENLKQISEEAMENLHAMNEENIKLNYLIPSLESSIISFQTNLDTKNKALEELERSHATICRELEQKTEAINLSTTRENCFSSENEMLKQEISNILCKEQYISELMDNIEADKSFVTIESRLQLITDHIYNYINEQINMVSKLSNELDIIQVSAEELSTQNSLLQSELIRKDELAKGLSFDLSLLQESASVAKDQAAELMELRKAIESLEQDLASKSLELDYVISDRQQLEARILMSNNKVAALEEELAKKLDELNVVSMENAELKSQLQHIEEISYAMEELTDKREAIGRLEEELVELRRFIDERNICLRSLQNDFSKLSDEKQCCDTQLLILKEKLEMAQALAEESEAIATESRQIAEEQKAYAEGKDEEVKLLERSIEELENTVCALESKVGIVKEEAERQRMQREELEVELQKVRQQMLTVPPSGKSKSYMEDGMVDLADLSRHPIDIHNDLLCAQESIRILEKEVSEKESEIAQCKAHISELNIHAEAAAREYKQKQMNSEKDEELSAAKKRIVELEGIAASRQREIFMLNARLATTESMTHDVIRDMLGVKMNMTTWAALADNQKKMEPIESVIPQSQEIKEQSNELMKLKKQLDEFIEERQSWLEEINQKQSELGAARINIEKLRQREHFMVAEIELLKAENTNYKTIILNLEDEVKKLTRQQNLQLRINHHVKTKEENILLKRQNAELSAKLQQLGAILTRTKEELARYRVSNGKDPYEQIEEEELLRKQLDESEQDRSKLAENLSSLCTSILKVAGVVNPEPDASLLKALECLNQLQCRIPSLESEVEELKLKCKLLQEKARLSELRSDSSSLSSGAKDGSTSPGLSRSPSISSFR